MSNEEISKYPCAHKFTSDCPHIDNPAMRMLGRDISQRYVGRQINLAPAFADADSLCSTCSFFKEKINIIF